MLRIASRANPSRLRAQVTRAVGVASSALGRTRALHSSERTRMRAFPEQAAIVEFLQHMPGSNPEVAYYLNNFSRVASQKFAVIKVGGAVLQDEIHELAQSLSFLQKVGLSPLVVHGAGPQLNDTLKMAGIKPQYCEGLRVTDERTLEIALKTFREQNALLVESLEAMGTRARPITGGVFEAEYLDRDKWGLVGKVTRVHLDPINAAIDAGTLPILVSVGQTRSGQALNINADIAAKELAIKVEPLKIAYLNTTGGMVGPDDKVISVINLRDDFERMLGEDWLREGTRLKLEEIKDLLDALPSSSSVTLTRASDLPRELFTHSGAGTLVRKGEGFRVFSSGDEVRENVDLDKLQVILEDAFNGPLAPGYFEELFEKRHIHKLYLAESHRAVALLTKEEGSDVPYLDKFAVVSGSQGEGLGELMWTRIRNENPEMYWRSRAENPINKWYFGHSEGSFGNDKWKVFWYGMDDFAQIKQCIDVALHRPYTIGYSHTIEETSAKAAAGQSPGTDANAVAGTPSRAFSTATSGSAVRSGLSRAGVASAGLSGHGLRMSPTSLGRTISSAPCGGAGPARRFMSTSTSPAGRKRVGIIGARGYTGVELMKLIAQHPQLDLVAVSSRQLAGKAVNTSVPGFDDSLRYSNLAAADINKFTDDVGVDVWVLALPNGVCLPYVEELSKMETPPVMIDLGADFRFTDDWAYGLPERFRDTLKTARRIANPGCYATGQQFSVLPFLPHLDSTVPPHIFGVSGYSGAGTTPGDANNPDKLYDNIIGYKLTDHIHEREVSRQMGTPVCFTPHVAPFFQGIHLTTSLHLNKTMTPAEAQQIAEECYADEPLLRVTKDVPRVRDNSGRHYVTVGGFNIDPSGKRLVHVTTLDNLLKGAATQCMQNINLSLGFDELASIDVEGLSLCEVPVNVNHVPKTLTVQTPSGDELTVPEADEKYVVNTYGKRAPFVIDHGKGMYVYTDDGRELLDLSGGIAVNGLGHGDRQVAKVIADQALKLTHVSNLFYTQPVNQLAARLVENSFADKAFICNSGTEANEAALKFARKHGRAIRDDKLNVVSFHRGFHGRSMGALAVTHKPAIREPFFSSKSCSCQGCACSCGGEKRFAPFNDLPAALEAIGPDTAAVIVEPVQGEGGIHTAEPEFLAGLRKACDEHDALLIFDEIQCGMGRTGTLWGHEGTGITPDIMTLAKPLAAGLPIGAVLVKERAIANIVPGDHGTTFGGGPLVTSAAVHVFDRISSPAFLKNVQDTGALLKQELEKLADKHASIKEVRAAGLLVGIQLNQEANPVIQAAIDQGLIIISAGPNTIRLAPSLIMERHHVFEAIDKLDAALTATISS